MNHLRRIILCTILVIAGASVSSYSQGTNPQPLMKLQKENAKSDEDKDQQDPSSTGLKKLTHRSGDQNKRRHGEDTDVDIHIDAIGSIVEEAVNHALASLEPIDINIEPIDINIEPIEPINIEPIEINIEPIEPIHIDIEPIQINIEPIEIDLDMNDIDRERDDIDTDHDEALKNGKIDNDKSKEKVKDKEKDQEKKQRKEEKGDQKEKSKGLVKIKRTN